MQRNGLLASTMDCTKCDIAMNLNKRKPAIDGYSWRCPTNRNHETSVRKFSYFESSKINIRDGMNFIKAYLDGHTLRKCSSISGLHYRSTAVDWASFCREIFMDYVCNIKETMVFSGTP